MDLGNSINIMKDDFINLKNEIESKIQKLKENEYIEKQNIEFSKKVLIDKAKKEGKD